MDLMQQNNIGKQSATLSFDVQKFVSYDELKMTFGSNENTGLLFWGTSSAQYQNKYRIIRSSGLCIKFIPVSYTHLDYGNTESAIFPVMVRNEHYVKEAARILFEQGIYVNPISYPAVPEKLSRLRFSLTAMHTKEELDKTFSILENIRKKYKLAQI